MSGIFDASIVSELEALRRRLTIRARSANTGDRISSRRGSSAEFLEHRSYAPGDDLRRIDWLAFARTGEPVLKLFRAEEDVVVRIVLDSSASMQALSEEKFLFAKRLTAAFAYMALANQERVQFFSMSNRTLRAKEPVRGKASLPKLLRWLDDLYAAGAVALREGLDDVLLQTSRPGMLVVVSDFLDPSGFETALGRAASARHDIALVQVLSSDDLNPTLDGDLELEDVETGEFVTVTVDQAALDGYQRNLASLFGRMRTLAKRLGATYVRTHTRETLIEPVRRMVTKGVD